MQVCHFVSIAACVDCACMLGQALEKTSGEAKVGAIALKAHIAIRLAGLYTKLLLLGRLLARMP